MRVTEPLSPSERNRRIVEALVLALAKSEVSSLINAGTLRYFIEFTLRDMLKGAALDLGPLWNTLAAEPGLTPEKIYQPLLRVASWQDTLGVNILLPEPMQHLSAAEREQHLLRCVVTPRELEQALADATCGRSGEKKGGQYVPSAKAPTAGPSQRQMPRISPEYLGASAAPSEESEDGDEQAQAPSATPSRKVSRWRLALLVGSIAVTVGAVAFLAVSLFGHHGTSIPLAGVEEVLVLENARRVDYVVTAVLVDSRWKSMSREERRKAVEAVFSILEREGVKTLILRAPTGQGVATISTVGGSRVVKVQ